MPGAAAVANAVSEATGIRCNKLQITRKTNIHVHSILHSTKLVHWFYLANC